MKVLVTGVSGYIGGETALKLKDAGHQVFGIDRRPLPNHLKDAVDAFALADYDSDEAYRLLFLEPDAVIHCAGTSLVGPSLKKPSEYYNNNFIKTHHFLARLFTQLPDIKFVFSSSAAVYGDPILCPCAEVDPLIPISPYGESKLMIEMMLASYHKAYGTNYVALRYFNACGADSQGRHGQEPGATHIIARALESIRDQQPFTLFGNAYPTPDGTCVRDYVHVEDIVDAHILAITTDVPAGPYNLGNAKGISNLQVIDAAMQVTNQKLDVLIAESREGDPAMLTASSIKFNQVTGWEPKYSLDDMLAHAWKWYTK